MDATQIASLIADSQETQARIRSLALRDPEVGARLTDENNYSITRGTYQGLDRRTKRVFNLVYRDPRTDLSHSVAMCDTRAEANMLLSARLGALIG